MAHETTGPFHGIKVTDPHGDNVLLTMITGELVINATSADGECKVDVLLDVDDITALLNILAQQECRHCGREVIFHRGGWIDPEADGDDSVWRDTCDSNHEDRIAAHEPKSS